MATVLGERTGVAPRWRPRVAATRWGVLAVTAASVGTLGFFVFRYLGSVYSADHSPHNYFVIDLLTKGRWLPHFLYHLAVVAMAGGSSEYVAVNLAAAGVLALALAARTGLTFAMINRDGRNPARTAGFCLALAFAMPLFNWWKFPSVYLGQISPNVWHNPTLIFAMPFGIVLFLVGDRCLRAPTWRNLAGVGIAMVLNALAKPNYLLAYGPCFGLALGARLLVRVRRGELSTARAAGVLAAAFGPVAAALAVQYLLTFTSASATGMRVVIAPWRAWSLYSPNIPASIVLGIVFPLAFCALNVRAAVRDRRLILAWLVLAVAIAQFAIFAETGKYLTAANFAWGSFLADYVLFVICCTHLQRIRPRGPRFWAPVAVLILHAGCGAFYLVRYLCVPTTGWI